jgi:flagellar biosynthesis GTPase FlhF
MKVKTFTGATINEALAAVKEEMGDSVLILETRSKPIDGIGGMFGKKMVEVIVADDDSNQANSSPFSVLGMANDEASDSALLAFEDRPNRPKRERLSFLRRSFAARQSSPNVPTASARK